MKIEYWKDSRGESPVAIFIETLEDNKTKKKILRIIDLLEKWEMRLLYTTEFMEKMRGLELYELRIRFRGIYYRIFFDIINNTAWFLHAFKKKTSHTPQKEINTALRRKRILEEYLGIKKL